MSKEVEFPINIEQDEDDIALNPDAEVNVLKSQIADLNVQVEGLRKDKDHWYSAYGLVFDQANEFKQRAEKFEAELATAKVDYQRIILECERQRTELAALREGATVTYRVEFQWGHSKDWEAVPAYVGDCCHAKLVGAENHMNSLKSKNTLRIVEVRERILDATGGEG